jgi:FkbM family methyltransferase
VPAWDALRARLLRVGGRGALVPTGPHDAPLRRIALGDGRSSINQRQLRRHGLAGWQPGTTAGLLAAWELTPRPGVFLDVGANAGVYSLLCRLLWPWTETVAFEPSPGTVEAGRRWAAANGVAVRFERAALSDHEGEGVLHLSSRSDASHSLVPGFREAVGTLPVDLLTLDGYVERTGREPTVVKIDVEGHEREVLRGARRTLERSRPVVVVELLDLERSREADALLRGLGYVSRRLDRRDHVYWPDAVPARWADTLNGWRRAVDRCVPMRAPPESRSGSAGSRIRWRLR